MATTRKETFCVVFGAPKQLNECVLPTYCNVIRHFLWIRYQLKVTSKKEPNTSEITELVANKLEELWAKASLPVLSHKRITDMIKTYYKKYQTLKKPLKSRKTEAASKKVKYFQDHANSTLFDITSCKCADFSLCKCKIKVPLKERAFLLDQRSERKMIISSVDVIESKKIEKKIARKLKDAPKLSKETIQTESVVQDVSLQQSDASDHDSDVKDPPIIINFQNPVASTSKSKQTMGQMRISLPKLAKACDRTGVSDRAAAIIASAVLEDLQIVTSSDSSKIIDRSKIRRARKRKRSEYQGGNKEVITGLYFDGRKDSTITQEMRGNRLHRKTVIEEHIVLVSEPGSKYIGHVTPSSGSASNIKKGIVAFLEKKADFSSLIAIGCDGTVVNTGKKNGAIRMLELYLKRPLQWLICLFHANELPLRHLLQHLDGPTSGPRGYSGPIGKALQASENSPATTFLTIPSENLPALVPDDLSSDQKYLWDICQAVTTGVCSESLAQRNPGKLSHSRWLTAANRILRLYVSSNDVTRNLQILSEYIVKVYAPVWFHIKLKPSCVDGPRHLLNMIKWSKNFDKDVLEIINPVIQRNGFYAHPENILISMVTDESKLIRELGYRRLLRIRQEVQDDHIRFFTIPKINFDATDFVELIDWQSCKLTEPPLLRNISNEDLLNQIGDPSKMEIVKYPCNTQAVERCVRLVTEASMAVCGEHNRDGFIKSRIDSRQQMPQFNTKREYSLDNK